MILVDIEALTFRVLSILKSVHPDEYYTAMKIVEIRDANLRGTNPDITAVYRVNIPKYLLEHI